jgi:hypothetical protein
MGEKSGERGLATTNVSCYSNMHSSAALRA